MSLQFDAEEFICPRVSDMYNSSDEDMDVDVLSVHEGPQCEDGPDSV